MRHSEIRNITTNLFSDVFQDIKVRKSLLKLWGKENAKAKTRLFRYTGKRFWVKILRAFA